MLTDTPAEVLAGVFHLMTTIFWPEKISTVFIIYIALGEIISIRHSMSVAPLVINPDIRSPSHHCLQNCHRNHSRGCSFCKTSFSFKQHRRISKSVCASPSNKVSAPRFDENILCKKHEIISHAKDFPNSSEEEVPGSGSGWIGKIKSTRPKVFPVPPDKAGDGGCFASIFGVGQS